MPYHDLPGSDSGPLHEDSSTENLPDPQHRRNGAHNLIIAAAIALLVGTALMHTYRSSTSASSRSISNLTSEIDAAMQTTKTAYALQSDSRNAGSGHNLNETQQESRERHTAENEAIAEWRKLAAPNHPVATRRLGLTLYMFNRKGGLDVLLGVGAQKTGRGGEGETGRRGERETIGHDAELATWQSLYGPKPIAVQDVPRLRSNIGKMNLGWFESIALEQLYARAGMAHEAHDAHLAAYRSADRLSSIDDAETLLIFAGSLMWMAILIRFLARRFVVYIQGNATHKAQRPTPNAHLTSRTGGIDALSVPTPDACVMNTQRPTPNASVANAQRPTPNAQHPTPTFSYRARTTAFAVFLASYLFIAYPMRAFLPDLKHWSDSAVMRLSAILQMGLYIPVVLIAIYTLRWMAASESGQTTRPGFRQTLAALGLRSSRPLADIAAGVQGYILVLPVFLIAALISSRVFQSVHTPINPVQIQALSAINPLDQLLLLIEAAVAAPIVEELMFRGLLFPALKSRWGYFGGVILTSAVFGLLHPNLPAGFLPLWTLGASFAVVFQRRKSLLPCIVMHSINNGFVTIMMFMVFAK